MTSHVDSIKDSKSYMLINGQMKESGKILEEPMGYGYNLKTLHTCIKLQQKDKNGIQMANKYMESNVLGYHGN